VRQWSAIRSGGGAGGNTIIINNNSPIYTQPNGYPNNNVTVGINPGYQGGATVGVNMGYGGGVGVNMNTMGGANINAGYNVTNLLIRITTQDIII
jgi:hypothetical protein